MRTIRYGKIARLPEEIREQVNRRMANHESSTTLLAWLNALPEVQAVVAQEFGGKAVMRQNLSEWRHGGWAEWLRLREARAIVKDLQKDGRQFSEAAGGSVTDTMAEWLAARYVVGMKSAVDSGVAWERMREFCHDVVALKRADHRTQRLEFERVRAATRAVGAPLATGKSPESRSGGTEACPTPEKGLEHQTD